MTPKQKRIADFLTERAAVNADRWTVEVVEHDYGVVEIYATSCKWYDEAVQLFIGKRGGLSGKILGQSKQLKGRAARQAWDLGPARNF